MMLELIVIGTGSAGNCVMVTDGEHHLLLDAGVPVRRVLQATGGLRGLEGCLVTHEHMDHLAQARKFAELGVDVYGTRGTLAGLRPHNRLHAIPLMEPLERPSFTVLPFPTEHDAAEPCGFLVCHRPTGLRLLYATDTAFLRNTFPGVNVWLVECNFVEELLEAQVTSGTVDVAMQARLLRSHMSLGMLRRTLLANDLSAVSRILLLHLSAGRSDEARIVREIREVTGREVMAAKNGMRIPLDMVPF